MKMIRGVLPQRLAGLLVLCLAGGIAAEAQPVLSLSASQLFFNYAVGGAVPALQVVNATSNTPAQITGAAIVYGGPASGWLSVVPSAGPTPLALNVFLNAAGVAALLPGFTYSAQITISAGVLDPTSQTTIGVFLAVTGAGGTGGGITSLTASPNRLDFAFAPGGTAPPAQTITVALSDGTGVFITKDTSTGGNWLSLSATQFAATPGTLTVTVNPAGLGPGVYSGTITVTGLQQLVIPVTLTIGSAVFTLSPATLNFKVPQNFGVSSPQFVQVSTGASVPFQVFPTSDGNWLQVDAPTGITPAVVSLRVNTGGLAQGVYTAIVTFQQGPSYSVDVPVTLTIGPPAVLSIAPSSVNVAWTIGDSVPIVQTANVRSTSTAVQTFSSAVSLVNGSGWLTATSSSTSTPAVVTVTVNPAGLAVGSYFGAVTLTPPGATASPQAITVALTVSPPPTPVITAVQSAASGAPGTVAPGQLVTIVGKGVGPKNLVSFPATSTSVPLTLGGTTVTFDGVAAPVIYTSFTATTVQVPYNIAVGATTAIRVNYAVSQSALFQLSTQAIYPGLFSLDSTGKGQAAALNQDFSVNSAGNPAKRGTILVLYGTGEGAVTPTLATGAIVPLTPPFPQSPIQPVVFFNGQQGRVLFWGEAPGSVAGLFQINVGIPENIPAGPISIQVAFGGQATQSGLTVAVQ